MSGGVDAYDCTHLYMLNTKCSALKFGVVAYHESVDKHRITASTRVGRSKCGVVGLVPTPLVVVITPISALAVWLRSWLSLLLALVLGLAFALGLAAICVCHRLPFVGLGGLHPACC